jgi:hypothetical protein
MPDTHSTEATGWSSRWRAVSLFIIATLQVMLVWITVRSIPRGDSWRLLFFGLITAALAATAYDIAKRGKLTRLAFIFWLCLCISKFVNDVYRFWNHDPNVDLFFTLFGDIFYIFIISVWIWRNPFGPKKIDSLTIKRDLT